MYCCLLINIYAVCLIVMNGRQRNATNAQIGGKKNDSNYDGNCTARHCLSGTYKISHRWIFVRLSVRENSLLKNYIYLNISSLYVMHAVSERHAD